MPQALHDISGKGTVRVCAGWWRGKRKVSVEHKLLINGTLMVKMGLSYVKTYFLPVDGTFHSELVLNRVA